MKTIFVTVYSEETYEFDLDKYTVDDAINIAKTYFAQVEPGYYTEIKEDEE